MLKILMWGFFIVMGLICVMACQIDKEERDGTAERRREAEREERERLYAPRRREFEEELEGLYAKGLSDLEVAKQVPFLSDRLYVGYHPFAVFGGFWRADDRELASKAHAFRRRMAEKYPNAYRYHSSDQKNCPPEVVEAFTQFLLDYGDYRMDLTTPAPSGTAYTPPSMEERQDALRWTMVTHNPVLSHGIAHAAEMQRQEERRRAAYVPEEYGGFAPQSYDWDADEDEEKNPYEDLDDYFV